MRRVFPKMSCFSYLSICILASLLLSYNNKVCAADFVWYHSNTPITYQLPEQISPVVYTALQMWRTDMQEVTGAAPRPYLSPKNGKNNNAIITFIQLPGSKRELAKLEALKIPVNQIISHKEAFYIGVKKGKLYVIGSDGRGLAYGILELSRLAGVSPWVWWGDVTPDHKTTLSLPDDYQNIQYPSVEYRGIFVNDEDWSLQPWSWLNYHPSSDIGLISAKAYTRVFHLLLRLRANMIWPGMHGNTKPFYWTKGAKEAADSCGIFIGTSHCEPLMSNANGEWDESARGPYNYITNRDSVLAYWTARLKSVGASENIYTIGMRGKHDGSMEGVHTLQEKTKALQEVINDQRNLLKKYVNADLTKVPQQFVPYKEVLDIYENGLNVPDDVMLTWCDDNYGYITRLSDSLQQKRSGGSGVYYHLSYWGRPHDYLWLTTTQPGLIYHEMKNAYNHNAKRLWIVNVHDPKVASYDLELFLDLAWDINLTSSDGNVETHLKNALVRDYGESAGGQLFDVMKEFYHLTAIRKPEFMGWDQVELDKGKYDRGISPVKNTEFSFSAFGDEADRYLAAYKRIKNIVAKVEKTIPADKQNAFFAGIKYPVYGAADMAIKTLEAQKARMLANGDYNAHNRIKRQPLLMRAAANSLKSYFEIREMTDYYNNQLASGKWQYDMCFNPRDLPVFDLPVLPIGLTDKEIADNATSATDSSELDFPIVQDKSFIARNASSFDGATFKAKPEPMFGHSGQAVPLPKNQSLDFNFITETSGKAVIRVAVIPTQPNDNGDIRYQIQLDDQKPMVISFRQQGRTEKWKLNVLRGQAVNQFPCQLSQGKHHLRITALDNHVIVDQWMVDFNPDRKFYVFPVK